MDVSWEPEIINLLSDVRATEVIDPNKFERMNSSK